MTVRNSGGEVYEVDFDKMTAIHIVDGEIWDFMFVDDKLHAKQRNGDTEGLADKPFVKAYEVYLVEKVEKELLEERS